MGYCDAILVHRHSTMMVGNLFKAEKQTELLILSVRGDEKRIGLGDDCGSKAMLSKGDDDHCTVIIRE